MILQEAEAHLARDPGAVLWCQYNPVGNFMQLGEGDLLVASRGRVTAFEFKHVDTGASGKTKGGGHVEGVRESGKEKEMFDIPYHVMTEQKKTWFSFSHHMLTATTHAQSAIACAGGVR